MKILLLSISLITFSLISSSSVGETGNASAKVVSPLSINVGNHLEFGSFASSEIAGTIDQAGVANGGVVVVSGGATRSAGIFTIIGASGSNTSYNFNLPSTVTLTDGSNSMVANLSFASGNGSRTLTSGTDSVVINGILNVGSNQASGYYTGNYEVTASY